MSNKKKNATKEVVKGVVTGLIAAETQGEFDFTRSVGFMSPVAKGIATVTRDMHRADLDKQAERIMKKAEEIEAKAQAEAEYGEEVSR